MSPWTEPRPIVVGIDGSPSSWGALDWATHEAALRATTLLLLHVRGPHASPGRVETLLRFGFERAMRADSSVEVRVRAETNEVDTAFVAASAEASVLVLGLDVYSSRADHGLRGPVEDRVVNHAVCPVVLVPGPGSLLPHPEVVAVVAGDSPGMCVAALSAQEAARRDGRLFLYVRAVKGNPSSEELLDRAMLEINFDHPDLEVRVKSLDCRARPSMCWEPVDRLALVVTSTQADDDRWAIRSDQYGTLLARELNVPIMLVTPLTFRSLHRVEPTFARVDSAGGQVVTSRR